MTSHCRIMQGSNMRPFTTTASGRSKPLVNLDGNRPKTALPQQTEVKLPKLKPQSGHRINSDTRKTLVNNYVGPQSCVNGRNSVVEGCHSNVSTPRSALSRSNSRKKSLKRTKSWRLGSVTSDNIGLDDSTSVVNGDTNRHLTAWDAFETHIKQVNDTAGLMEFDDKTLDFKCSETFKRIMSELSPKKVKKVEKKLSSSTSGSRNDIVFDEADEEDESEEDEEEETDDYIPGVTDYERRRRRRALRAWGLVRRHIQEIRVERRMAAGSINWDFLRQTISALSDMEKARQELYEKYIYKPNWWADGLTKCPEHLVRKYQNSGPLLPPVPESNHPPQDARTKRQSRPNTSLTNNKQSARINRRPTGLAHHSRTPLKAS